jgi:hypothetical protein
MLDRPMPYQRVSDLIANLAEWIGLRLDDWRRRAALRREFADLKDRHILDATLADTGLSRDQVPVLVRGFPQRERLFRRMAARLGVPLSRIPDRATRHEMMWTCTTCTSAKRCRTWLDDGRTRGHQAFCPNAATFDAFRAGRGARSR